ncbi:dolichyl-phosphate-mannose-protein mannosyltransferase [Leptospira yanagawae serovar Saopaulo str. Sao Paulo = ATCC 700523]|uniref:Dolichyl-phosphate-mannose-protein mannosyltransferase n=1 Tax=Leptospira yanagawae serovar Saopaulo str. Sao Paulo = ATCC 700523 TaxID=1249483 RepID=A0A5E8H9D3_9LEPT|nr:glycosyltransferase family 39 protein [Leptospira yanagawae]EOQ87819.1 dolichyl-phosphate-mannose-protein mannosyltransferase [Leptospira yanagawae serovar Saopaulo str. Sao Paulo = ATCC 700523]
MPFFTPKRTFLLLLIGFSLYLFWGNASPLIDQDEAAYAGFARNMAESKDYLKMEFPYSEPHRKPPLQFWITSAFFEMFGTNEFVLRIFPALCILGTSLLTYHLAHIMFNSRTALYAFSILSFSLYFPLNGKIALVDSSLVFFGMIGFVCLYHLIQSGKWIYVFIFWSSVSLGLLIKGPPILIFLCGTCFVLLFFSKVRPLIWKLHPWFGLPLAILPIFYWGYESWQRDDGALIRWMIDWYILRRATNPVFGQSGPPGTYLVLFFITLFPWTRVYLSFLKEMFWRFISHLNAKEMKDTIFSSFRNGILLPLSPRSFLMVGLIFSWVFYEFISSKLPSYPLSAYPILSILLAEHLSKKHNQIYLYRIYLGTAILMFCVIGFVIVPKFSDMRKETKILAETIQKELLPNETLYSFGGLGIPSFAFYLERKVEEISIDKILTVKGKILLTDSDRLMLDALGVKTEAITDPISLYAYDRNKKLTLRLVKTNP